jgi:hypothetical protein
MDGFRASDCGVCHASECELGPSHFQLTTFTVDHECVHLQHGF